MISVPELYILRHGQTHWNAEGRMQGELNSALTELGMTQAIRQGELLSGVDLQGFSAICSPQGRAFQTAGLAVAPHLPVIRTDDRLREIGVGDWQGKLREGLWDGADALDGPDGPIAFYEHAPGGEGFDKLEGRCRAFLDSLTGPAVLITHGITSRMLRSLILCGSRAELARVPGGQGIVFHLIDGQQSQLG